MCVAWSLVLAAADCCLTVAGRWWLCVVRCSLFVACCLLYVVCALLLVVCCCVLAVDVYRCLLFVV